MSKQRLNFLLPILLGILIALIIKTYIVQPIQIQGSSMYPTYENKEIGFAGKIFSEDNIKRNDVVVINAPDRRIIKRVIGLPGEKIEYINNILYINGEEVEDEFASITDDFSITVPEGEYLCLGDNRTNSIDSRNYGTFKFEQIYAKGIFILINK